MFNSWTRCLLILCTLTALSFSLPTSLNKDAKKSDQMTRIKREQHHPIESNKNFIKDITKFVSLAKRAQETLMFGNQQNRQPENRGNPYVSSTEKRSLNAAGLDSLKMSLTKENKFPNAKSPRNSLDERKVYNPRDNKNYEYGKVIVTEEGDEIPQVSDVASYTRYYMNDDRRKRLEKFIPNIHTTTVPPSCTEYHMAYPTQNPPIQMKKNIPIYAEPRYKREVEIHPEPVWNLLSMWGNGHRNRYTNEDYDNEEDGDLIEDEDPRNALAWMNAPGYSSYRYGTDTLPPSEIGIVHTHPSAYYDQYENQYGQQFDNGVHPYINQYGSLYSQDSYYPTERKYITTKKRTPSYDSYVNVVPLQMGIQPRAYPPYPHHMVY
ncbi:prohormone-2-like isoform X1 [Polistes fuscatus]|uniref:prohormone-2-like isoform X1 n=1 Tax=Polistes fuscatus TaxID=30207 RepID=UPI001CAA2563|nr:prohormone-2-like isoform X1 [Polistes fuscatus]